MLASLQEIKDAASMLPVEERADLAQFVADSLKSEIDPDVLAQWLDLAEQRMADVKAGKVVGIPMDEFLRSLPGSEG